MPVQSCPTLCDPMDCSLPVSPVHEILQARILEWVACLSPGDRADSRIEPVSPATPGLAGRFFYHWASWETLLNASFFQKNTDNRIAARETSIPCPVRKSEGSPWRRQVLEGPSYLFSNMGRAMWCQDSEANSRLSTHRTEPVKRWKQSSQKVHRAAQVALPCWCFS